MPWTLSEIPEEEKIKKLKSKKLVEEAPYHPGYEDAVVYDGAKVSPCQGHAVESEKEEGRKFDGGKLEYGLLPPHALEETVKVLTFGAQKYERNNWIHVDDGIRRYFDALQRHVWAWKRGEQIDPESGLHHLAHAMCCLMFLYEREVIYNEKEVK